MSAELIVIFIVLILVSCLFYFIDIRLRNLEETIEDLSEALGKSEIKK